MNEHIEQIELRSEEVQEILTKVPHWMIRWGNVLFLALILMLLFLSWFVKYPDIIISEAIITTQIPPQKEYAKITGRLDTLLIENNEQVYKNQPLAVLENTAKFQDVLFLKSILDTLKINSKSFDYPIDNVPVLFLGDIDSDYALFENSFIQYKLNKELQPFSNVAVANRFSVSELKRRLANLNAQKELNTSELAFIEKDLKRNETLFDKGVISAMEYENKQLEYLRAQRNYKNMTVSISQIKEAISNASNTLQGTTISKTKEDMVLLKNVIQSYNQLKKSIKDWELRYLLQSRIDGNVSFLNFWTENQNVNQGDLVFTIIPIENTDFIAKLKTPAQNSGKIKVGQKVNIKLENFPDTEFGTLQGTVKNISLIPDVDGFYLIDVSLPSTLVTSYKKEIEFKQEMRGIAEIVTEDLRLIERFFYQFKEVFSR
ncbi:hemolysin [Patiriisocius marinus]|uniref:Hemolysin n=1 Tax=Patiriisocius marinus TaxID=1397112 RepID=A0A5J4J0L8_9FLAO|nr:HlyD family efflux transporter periplasmic adaptor subunit [Patiriisocius marinus]GER59498.1 hemolysin [Patiriisocius marinus]